MNRKAHFVEIPKTRQAFINVNILPVRTRIGREMFVDVCHGGTVHVFDRHGFAAAVPPPSGVAKEGAYTYGLATEPGCVWFSFHAVKPSPATTPLALLDVETRRWTKVLPTPIQGLTTGGGTITADGFFCVGNTRGHLLIYDTRAERVVLFETLIEPGATWPLRSAAAPDGCLIVGTASNVAAFHRIDPRTGQITRFQPAWLKERTGTGQFGFLPDGRLAVIRGGGLPILVLPYPSFVPAEELQSPDGESGWEYFQDGGGRWGAYKSGAGLYAWSRDGRWRLHVCGFKPELPGVPDIWSWTILDDGLIAMAQFGEVCWFDPDGKGRVVRQLDNLGHQGYNSFCPGAGSKAYTGTFINSSIQEVDYRTGVGRDINRAQKSGGQINCMTMFNGKLFYAGYAGATIGLYNPLQPVEYGKNPWDVAAIGHEQMRPTCMVCDDRHLWITSQAYYGKLGGALTRFDPRSHQCKVWRHLVPDHNLVWLALDSSHPRLYVGTSPYADGNSCAPAPSSAAVFAFDHREERLLWTARPLAEEKATYIHPVGVAPSGELFVIVFLLDGSNRNLLLDCASGKLLRPANISHDDEKRLGVDRYFNGPDGRLYAATEQGVFELDVNKGFGRCLLEGKVTEPRVRGRDLFFLRDHTIGVVEDFFTSTNSGLIQHRGSPHDQGDANDANVQAR
ncbi:MAG: hypothetical protein HY360_26590 [Verrucomicrobia bacterium]|nr:hypothetical protein [Verrucomicrobiota bacterium]